jgi:UPF0755 protein
MLAPGRLLSTRRRAITSAVTLGVGLLAADGCGVMPRPGGTAVRVVIPTGASFRAAALALSDSHVIAWPRLFRVYAFVGRRDRAVRPGTYVLHRDIGWAQALDAVTHGRGLVRLMTIPEGWDLASIVPLLARILDADSDSVAAAVRDTALRREVSDPAPTLEGYLYPDTYSFPDSTPPRAAVAIMVREFERAWQPSWDAHRQALGMTRHEAVTLASIIEKEARLPEERPVISAVYHNRLRLNMPLQADPTVEYALGRHVEHLYFKDLTVESPYNTYRHTGLPPGPIASPGKHSLEAAVLPADVPYLYFVATADGHHEFRTTLAEHDSAKKEIRGKK